MDLKAILKLPWKAGAVKGHKNPGLDLLLQECLEVM
jgi:hypothetical protein